MSGFLSLIKRTLWTRLSADRMLVLASPAPMDEPEWTADDRARVLQFLQSESGSKLLLVLRSKEELLKAAACDESQRRVDHARGVAVGYRQALASLIVLSAPPPPDSEEKSADDGDPGASELRNQMTP